MSEKRRLVVRLRSDGTITAETAGIYGDECVPYAQILEDLCGAEAIDSGYTADYQIRGDVVPERNEVTQRDFG